MILAEVLTSDTVVSMNIGLLIVVVAGVGSFVTFIIRYNSKQHDMSNAIANMQDQIEANEDRLKERLEEAKASYTTQFNHYDKRFEEVKDMIKDINTKMDLLLTKNLK